MGGCVNSAEIERFGGGATLPSEVKFAKSKSLYNFEVVNKKNCIEYFSSLSTLVFVEMTL